MTNKRFPSAQVRSVLEAISDPQALALGIMQDVAGSPIRFTGLPVSFDGERPPLRRAAPALGEHNDEIKGETE